MAKTNRTIAAAVSFDVALFAEHGKALVQDTARTANLLIGASHKWDDFLLSLCQSEAGALLAGGKLTPNGQAIRKAMLALREQIKTAFVAETEETGKAMIGRIGQAWHICVNPKAREKATGSVQTWARALGPNRTCMLDSGLAPVGAVTGRKASTVPATPAAKPVVHQHVATSAAPTISTVQSDAKALMADIRQIIGKDALGLALFDELQDNVAAMLQHLAKKAQKAVA